MDAITECSKDVEKFGQSDDEFDPKTHCSAVEEFKSCVEPLLTCPGQIQETLQKMAGKMNAYQQQCEDMRKTEDSEPEDSETGNRSSEVSDGGKGFASKTKVSVLFLLLSITVGLL